MTSDRVVTNGGLRRITVIVLVVEGLAMFVPLIVLGTAIDWPASLDRPPALVLPAVADNIGAVRLGYVAYLAYSLAFWPLAVLVNGQLGDDGGSSAASTLLRFGAGCALASTICRSIGIIRWLGPMPLLADRWKSATISGRSTESVEVAYESLNSFGGAIGEVLGVGLFAGIWIAVVSVTILRTLVLPAWTGQLGVLASVGLFASLLEAFGLELGAFISVQVTVVQLWFLALAYAIWKAPQPHQPATVRSRT